MKKRLGMVLRIVVSVGILAYLFHGIFRNEVEDVAEKIAAAPHLPAPALAQGLGLRATEVTLIREHCLAGTEVNLKAMAWPARTQLVWRVGPRALWKVFSRVNPVWFALAVGSLGIVCVLGVIRWRLILHVQGLELPFWRACSITFIGLFFNAFMLGATGGDVIKAWYAAHETHHKKAEAVATVIVDRVIGLLVLFVIALTMMLAFWHRVYDDQRLRVWTVFTLLVVTGSVAGTALTFWKGFADQLPGLRRWLEKLPKYDTLRRMIDAARGYASHPVVLGKTVLLTVGVHFFSMLAIVFIGIGLELTSAHFVDYFLYLPIINSIAAVPISISGFGVREGMYVAMFGRVGVAAASAVALSLLGYFASLVWSVVGAGFYLTHRKEIPSAGELARGD